MLRKLAVIAASSGMSCSTSPTAFGCTKKRTCANAPTVEVPQQKLIKSSAPLSESSVPLIQPQDVVQVLQAKLKRDMTTTEKQIALWCYGEGVRAGNASDQNQAAAMIQESAGIFVTVSCYLKEPPSCPN